MEVAHFWSYFPEALRDLRVREGRRSTTPLVHAGYGSCFACLLLACRTTFFDASGTHFCANHRSTLDSGRQTRKARRFWTPNTEARRRFSVREGRRRKEIELGGGNHPRDGHFAHICSRTTIARSILNSKHPSTAQFLGPITFGATSPKHYAI